MRITRTLSAAAFVLLAALVAAPAPCPAFSLERLFGSPVDAKLAAQIPQGKRAAINDAEYVLACANEDVDLAKLKDELADKQSGLAAAGLKLAKAQARGAEIALDLAKMEAISANGLGKPEENAKITKDLKAEAVKNESDQAELKNKVYQANLFVRDWTQRVALKEKDVAAFKSRRSGTAGNAPADAAKPAAPKAAAPAQDADPALIINKTPDAAAPAPETPEADLKN